MMSKKSERKPESVEMIIGARLDGVLIKEDKDGIRFYVENGIRISEPVMLVPGKGGFTYKKGELGIEFMTKTEREQDLKDNEPQERRTTSLTDRETPDDGENEVFKINTLSESSVSYFLANNTIAGPKHGWSLISTLEGLHFINPIQKIGIDCLNNQRVFMEECFMEFVSCFDHNGIISKNCNIPEILELAQKIKELSVKSIQNDESATSNVLEKVAETFFLHPKTEKTVDLSIEQRQCIDNRTKTNENKKNYPILVLQARLDSITNSLKYREQHLKSQEVHSINWVLNIIKTDDSEFFSKVHTYILQLEERFIGMDNKSKSEAINKTIAIKILNQPYPEYDTSSLAAQITTIAKTYPIFEYPQPNQTVTEVSDYETLDIWIQHKTGISEFSIISSEMILKESKIIIQSDCSRAWVLTGDNLTEVESGRLGKIEKIVKSIQTNPILGQISQSKKSVVQNDSLAM